MPPRSARGSFSILSRLICSGVRRMLIGLPRCSFGGSKALQVEVNACRLGSVGSTNGARLGRNRLRGASLPLDSWRELHQSRSHNSLRFQSGGIVNVGCCSGRKAVADADAVAAVIDMLPTVIVAAAGDKEDKGRTEEGRKFCFFGFMWCTRRRTSHG